MLLALAAPLVAAVGVPPPSAAQDDPSPAGTAEGATLTLVRQTTWVRPDGRFTVEVRSPEPIDAEADLAIRLHEPVGSREELAGGPLVDPGPVRFELFVPVALARQSDGDLSVDLATDAAGPLPIGAPGVYPVSLELAGGGAARRLVTHLVRVAGPTEADPDEPPLAVATIVPVGGRPAIRPAGTVRTRGRNLDRVVERVDALTATPQIPLTVLPVPETLESLGRTDIGTGVVDDLVGALDGRQVLESTYVEVDAGRWLAEGMGRSLRDQRAAGRRALTRALGFEGDSATAVLTEAPTPGLLGDLESVGVRRFVLPGTVPTGDGGGTPVRPLAVSTGTGTLTAVVSDAGLAAHKGSTGDPVLDAHRLVADLALLDQVTDPPAGGQPPGVVLMFPAEGVLRGEFTRVVFDALDDGPLTPVTLDGLGEAEESPVVDAAVLETRRPRGLAGYPASLSLTRLTLGGFTTLAGPSNPLVDDLERRTLASGSLRLRPVQRRAYLSSTTRTIRGETALVGAPRSQTVTLTSRDGDIPLALTNDAGYPVDVRITFDSDRLEFPEGDTLDVTLEPGGTAVSIRVRARATGSFPLQVEITSPDGVLVVASSRITVRSTAVSGVGLALSIGAGLILLVWWLRHFRRSRPSRP